MMTASTASAPSQVSGQSDQGSAGAVNFGNIDVTLSAAFYTGVFLSSRELQGNYLCHQDMVVCGMNSNLPWGWDFPRYGCDHWNGTVSPMYFVGTDLSNIGDMGSKIQLNRKIQNAISNLRNDFNFSSINLRVRFFEFGFGLVSIEFKNLTHKHRVANSAAKLKEILQECEEKSYDILSCIAERATRAYRKSVPCCIKNSDIWDIDNFNGLEISDQANSNEGIYKVGDIEEIHIFATLEAKDALNYKSNNSDLEQIFLYISQKLSYSPYNVKFKLFKSDNNISFASITRNNRQTHQVDLSAIIEICGMVALNIAIGRYFSNFFFSFYNYVLSEYEIIAARDHARIVNRSRLRNLLDKFIDVQAIYSQATMQFDEYTSIYAGFSNLNLIIDISKWLETCNQVTKFSSQISDLNHRLDKICNSSNYIVQLRFIYLTVGFAIFSPIVTVYWNIFSYENYNFDFDTLFTAQNIGLLFFIITALILSSSYFCMLPLVFGKVKNRKLKYICRIQKRSCKRDFKLTEKSANTFIECAINDCHRCRGLTWHKRVFY